MAGILLTSCLVYSCSKALHEFSTHEKPVMKKKQNLQCATLAHKVPILLLNKLVKALERASPNDFNSLFGSICLSPHCEQGVHVVLLMFKLVRSLQTNFSSQSFNLVLIKPFLIYGFFFSAKFPVKSLDCAKSKCGITCFQSRNLPMLKCPLFQHRFKQRIGQAENMSIQQMQL